MYLIYLDGIVSHNQGTPLRDNPYRGDARAAEAWRRGWIRTFKVHQKYKTLTRSL